MTEPDANPGAEDIDVSNVPEAAADDSDIETTEQDTESDAGDGESDGQADGGEDDSEEVEYEGKSYRLPKELKGALLRQADYTRKTMEVAEARKAAETQLSTARQLAEQADNLTDAHIAERVLQARLEQLRQVDLRQLQQTDPFQATALIGERQQLQDQLQAVTETISKTKTALAEQQERDRANRLAEAQAELQRAIPNWGPRVQQQITDTGRSVYGFTPEELSRIDDPRYVRVLHDAAAFQRLRAKQTAAAPQEKPKAEPVPTVGKGKSPSASVNPDKLSMEEWVRYEKKRLAARR